MAAVHRRAGQGEGRRRDPALARRAVDAEAPARDRHDRDARPGRWAALWKKGANWNTREVKLGAQPLQDLLDYTNSDAASLTWQDASKLVADGKAAFNVMGDWADGYFRIDLKKKPVDRDYSWAAVPGTGGVYDWLSDSFTLPKGAPNRAAAIQWLGFLGSKQAQDTFNPVKGSIPARQDANPKLYDTYLKWALKQWKTDKLAGSLDARRRREQCVEHRRRHGARPLPPDTRTSAKFQTALVNAAKARQRNDVMECCDWRGGDENVKGMVGTGPAPGLPLDRPDRRLRLRPHRLERQGVAERLAHGAAHARVGPGSRLTGSPNADPRWSIDLRHILLFTVDVHRRAR